MRHSPRKRFGQNFLHSTHIINDILYAINPQPEENVLEIGPGLGALTIPLLGRLQHLTAVEIDRDLQAYLQQLPQAQGKLRLIPEDALTLDYSQFGPQLRVVGNLPYNISTPILLRLLESVSAIEDMHFMLQKEVVQRIAAQPGSKAYGRLSILLQYFCEAESLFDVPPEAFDPQPKVESAIIKLTPYKVSPYETVPVADLQFVVAKSFGMRRKTLANNLKGVISVEQLTALGIDPGKRPEQLAIKEYVQLAKVVPNGVK